MLKVRLSNRLLIKLVEFIEEWLKLQITTWISRTAADKNRGGKKFNLQKIEEGILIWNRNNLDYKLNGAIEWQSKITFG